MKTQVLCVLCALAALGCEQAPSNKDRHLVEKAPLTGSTTVRAALPVVVRWEEVSREAGRAVVRATIERKLGLDLPLSVAVELPAGVKAARGRTAFTLTPNVEAITVAEELELTFENLPAGDALLKVDADSGAFGIHSRVPYRFGRPEPVTPAPAATGPHLMRGDRDLGASIPLR